jgi:hypothetical protein
VVVPNQSGLKHLLRPAKADVIKLTFNSDSKMGLQDKQITITANTVPAETSWYTWLARLLIHQVINFTKMIATFYYKLQGCFR